VNYPNIRARAKPRNFDPILQARGRLKESRVWFALRGWEALPRNDRGRRILQWVADQASLAYPRNPEAAVRRICQPLAPWLSDSLLEQLVETTKTSNKRWSHDHSAMVLGISVGDCLTQAFRFLGAADDPDYVARHEAKLARKAASARKRRAAKSSGRPRGRPSLGLSPEEMKARSNAQTAERMKQYRLRKNASPDNIKKTGEATHFSVTDPILVPPDRHDQRREPKRPGACSDGMIDEMIHGGVALLARRRPNPDTAWRSVQ
jgi:hypothetical protein